MTDHNPDILRDFIERGRKAQEAVDKLTKGFTCPRCGKTSYHPKDLEEGYCGHCHDWTGKEAGQ